MNRKTIRTIAGVVVLAVAYGAYAVIGGDGQQEEEVTQTSYSTPAEQTQVNCPAWFELPAQKDADANGIEDSDKDLYYSWTMRTDAPGRNFSACYSKSMRHPVWVAAPMHKCYKGSTRRSEAWQKDPGIGCEQSYKYKDYTRGHMIGSSDRTVSEEANEQVFYYSNIGAQLRDGFNSGNGAWNYLESLVDDNWCRDTLYQVVGCIFDTFTDRYGNTKYSHEGVNGAGKRFQVPTAWYKVLLRTKKGNTGKCVDQCTADELQCAAFILLHENNEGHRPCKKDMYTVDELEKLTGLDFFVNVPDAPEDRINASDWGL